MDIGEGAGLSGASGIRPFLPALLAGALARGDHGINFSHTSYSFLESPAFLIALLVLALGAYAYDARRGQVPEGSRDPVDLAAGLIGLVLGALLFAGTLAGHHHQDSWIGLIAGVACAALGYLAVAAVFGRARRRLRDAGGALALLSIYADVIALALAGIAILVPVVAYAALVVFVVLVVRTRGDRAQKFQGLRILR